MFKNIGYHPGILLLHLKEISILFILILLVVEYILRNKNHPFEIKDWPKGLRWASYLLLFYLVLFQMQYHGASEFIYFQF